MKCLLSCFVSLVLFVILVNLLYIISGQLSVRYPINNRLTNITLLSEDVYRNEESHLPEIFQISDIQPKNYSNTNSASVKVVRRMNGYNMKNAPKMITCGPYKCKVEAGQVSHGADIVFFNEQDLDHYIKPPAKDSNVLWGFQTKEPQNHMYKAASEMWDGLFNYSITYVRQSDGIFYSYRDRIIERPSPQAVNFSAQHTQREPRALWFVSHCLHKWVKHKVWSGRVEYVQELAKYISIDVYTRSKGCIDQLGSLIKSPVKGHQPHLSNYLFYLSFESTVCTEYITEKFWKVVEANGQTIPIVLGGRSMHEYERIAPPNSYLHVRNFTSPKALADHLKVIANNPTAFNYYHEWRNKYYLQKKKKVINFFGDYYCYFCEKAHEKPANVWDTFSKDFGRHQCIDVSTPDLYCPYYNLSCGNITSENTSTSLT